MARALELARAQNPHPNPRVGSVVLDASGEVVGEGAHVRPGDPHAEVLAVRQAGERARGGVLYSTLEPCAHHGRTPPCVDTIIAAGVVKVVVGIQDPDPRVSGQGIHRLREAGVEVIEGIMEVAARDLDPGYFHHRQTGRSLVTLKYAMTLDGAVAAVDSTSRWITSDEARQDAHRLRAEMDGVVVGAGTLRSDDPLLDVRLDGFEGAGPRPVIIAGSGELPGGARIWGREPIVVATRAMHLPSGELVQVPGDGSNPNPADTCRALADMGLLTLLLEGGPSVAGAWWRAGVIDRGVAYLGAKIAGGSGRSPLEGVFGTLGDATAVSITGVNSLGVDLRVDFELG
jgi:diaminohydroxyphosphoribosylaminopyrimidine deaminase/5-amino-6-(5-phosphoribosylamino)uracil reductase